MDLGILNTIIALVVVLLVLSLLVQAVQTLFKKLLKLKSKQIEGSLKDLYEQAISGVNPPDPEPLFKSRLLQPLSQLLLATKNMFRPEGSSSTQAADEFKDKVLTQFKNIGRKTLFGNAVLDSLSKEDLFKVLGKLESQGFFPDYIAKFQALCEGVLGLKKALEALTENTLLRGAASTKVAEITSILAPIFNDVTSIMEGETKVRSDVLFADLLRLGKLDIGGVLGLLDEAQQAITQEKELAIQANQQKEVDALQDLSAELTKIAAEIGKLSQKFVDAVSPLRNKLEQIEVWFDTVTQSFDERYSRHMRTVSICLSIVIVIVLNADFFQVYKSLSTNEIQRNMIADTGADLLKELKEAQATRTPASQPEQSPAQTPAPEPNATPASSPPPATPAASPSPTPKTIAELKKDLKEIDSLINTYESFGFKPLSGEQADAFFWSLGGFTKITHGNWGGFKFSKEIKDGKEIPQWTVQDRRQWWESRKDNIVTLVGWAIMIMLLSVGAPFWQDTLESLFGIKNLLRQKSGTQNIEAKSGTGQPKE